MTATDREHIEEIIKQLKRVEKDYRIDLTAEMQWLLDISSEDLETDIRRKHAAYMHELERIEDKGSDRALILSGGISAMEDLRPELKESEDEKIRKAIKYGLNYVFTNNTTVYEVTKEQCLDWLEQQREPTDILADAVLDSNKDGLIADTIRHKREKQGEQKPVLRREEDLDRIRTALFGTYAVDVATRLLNKIKSCGCEADLITKQEWSEEDKDIENSLENIVCQSVQNIGTVCKVRYIDWLKSLKDRVDINYEIETNEQGEPCADSYVDYATKRLEAANKLIEDFKKAMK